MVWGHFGVVTQICIFSFTSKYPNKSFILLDRIRLALLIDINYVPMDITIDVYRNRELEKCNFQYIFFEFEYFS